MSMEMNKALDLLREIRPSIPKEVLELWCKDRDAFLASHPAVEQAGGDERAKFEYWASDEGIYPKAVERSGNCYKLAQTQSYWMAWQARAALASIPVADESPMAKMADALREKARQEQQAYQDRRNQATEWGPMPEGTEADRPISIAPVAHVAGDETSRYLEWAKDRSAWEMPVGTPVYYAALAQPSPAQTQPSPAPTLRAAIDVANDRFEVPVAKWGTDLVGEEERPEVAEVAFVLRNIGAMDAEDIDGDNVDLRFEDAEGRDTGCDVSIVEYAEKAADLFEQHDRIVGELRAVIAQLRQHKNDYMDSGQETYRALQNEIREREAEIARLDGLVSGRTAERDAALARVAELKTMADNYCALLMDANTKLAELEKKESAQAQHSVPEGWVQSLPLKDHQPCKPNEDRANGYTIPIYSRPVLVEEALRKLRAVLCDPIGNVVIDGSDGDREEVQRALGMLAAAPGKEVGHE